MNNLKLFLALAVAAITTNFASAQTPADPTNLVRLDAVVSAPITPDTAVLTMAAEKSGADASGITLQINKIMGDAVREAKATNGVEAITGRFSTYQQYDNKGNVTGWTVRTELILKSKDFASLGKLAGNLSQSLKIINSGFEISRELRSREESALLQRGLEAFQAKANTAARSLGFTSYKLREVNIQQAQLEQPNQPRPMMMARSAAISDAAPVQIEAGLTSINLTVSGSIQLK